MITIFDDNCNTLNQKIYDTLINSLSLYQLPCTCNAYGTLKKHGFYKRSYKSNGISETIKILRVKCSRCGKTHAILPRLIVPYSQALLPEHIAIINSRGIRESLDKIMIRNEAIDESNISYILHMFKTNWKERLKSFDIPLFEASTVIKHCFRFFGRQFMQIKSTPNILFIQNHIT